MSRKNTGLRIEIYSLRKSCFNFSVDHERYLNSHFLFLGISGSLRRRRSTCPGIHGNELVRASCDDVVLHSVNCSWPPCSCAVVVVFVTPVEPTSEPLAAATTAVVVVVVVRRPSPISSSSALLLLLMVEMVWMICWVLLGPLTGLRTESVSLSRSSWSEASSPLLVDGVSSSSSTSGSSLVGNSGENEKKNWKFHTWLDFGLLEGG